MCNVVFNVESVFGNLDHFFFRIFVVSFSVLSLLKKYLP